MSVESWNVEKDLCRCCHAQGSFDNLAVPQTYLDDVEIYTDMLKDCLNIEICPVPGDLCIMTYKICKTCIKKLRNANNFRKQVKSCEELFLDMFHKNRVRALNSTLNVIVKKEEHENTTFKTIDLKEEDSPSPADDDDYHIKHDFDDEDDKDADSSDDDISLSKCKLEKSKRGSKCKEESKSKKERIKKEKTQRSKFYLRPDDYKTDGDKITCSHCERIYDKMCSLRCHVKTKHYKVPQYKCSICAEEFMTLAPFTTHKLHEHNIDDRFKCNACKGVFNTKIQLKKHINNFHMLGEKYKCDLCDYESFSFEGMYKHKFKHKTSKDYHCKFCPKSFLRKTTLDLHERIHTGDRRKVCKVCNQAFVQKSSLNYHMSKYHPEVNF